jgi:IPT/TIG domain
MLNFRIWAPLSLCFIAFTLLTARAQSPTLGTCLVFPADNIWNTPVDQLPVSTNSAAWAGTIGSAKGLHPDFGSDPTNGIPFVTVPGTQAKYPATFTYAAESDPGPYAIPLNASIEGGISSSGDRHAVSIDTDNCILYEMWSAYPQAASWSAGSGAIFNLKSDALRPSGWTSTDAAGLPVFAGLVRYDEVAAGAINHALRFTVPQTQDSFLWPARHAASSLTGSQYPPMGARFRLRASYDISGFSPANQVILKALKKYGMMVADNGSSWFITGSTDPRWNDSDLHNLGSITGSEFEAVDASGLMVDPNSGQALQAAATSVTVSPSSVSVQVSGTQQFTATVTNATSQGVVWSVNGVTGGNATVGLINTSGLYTAPAAVPSGGTVTIRATSSVAPTAVGSATVTITAATSVAPILSSVAPNSGVQGTNVSVTLTGSNFKAGASIAVSGSGVSATSVSVLSATQINAVFAIAGGATVGAHSVTVTTSSGTSAAQVFTVNASVAGKPTLSSVSPKSARRGTRASVTLTGTNFTTGATVTFLGSGVTVGNVVVVNSSTITASFSVSTRAPRQAGSVSVKTAAGGSNSLTFTVQ